jgi:hypothetical protein
MSVGRSSMVGNEKKDKGISEGLNQTFLLFYFFSNLSGQFCKFYSPVDVEGSIRWRFDPAMPINKYV